MVEVTPKLEPPRGAEAREGVDIYSHVLALVLLRRFPQQRINKTGNVILVDGPEARAFIPQRVEGFGTDHKVFRPTHNEVWVDLDNVLLRAP